MKVFILHIIIYCGLIIDAFLSIPYVWAYYFNVFYEQIKNSPNTNLLFLMVLSFIFMLVFLLFQKSPNNIKKYTTLFAVAQFVLSLMI